MKKFLKSLLFIFATMCALPAFADDLCKNLLNPANIINGSLIDSNVNSTTYRVATNDLIPVTPGQQYTVSVYDANGAVNPDFTIYEIYGYNDAGGFNNNIRNSAATSAQNVAFTVPSTSVYIRFSIKRVDGATITPADVLVQLEKGSTATSYVPYNPLCATCQGIVKNYESAVGTVAQNGTPSPANPIEPTFYTQGDMVLRRVGDVADSYDAATGKITRRIGVKTFNGTEWLSMSGSQALQPYRFIADSSAWGRGDGSIVCSHFIAQSGVERGTCFFSNTEFIMQMVTDTTLDGFRQFLVDQYANGTPVTVYYPLAEAVEETPASTTYCADAIKIATTAYNDAQFAPVEAALETAVDTIKDVVANTIVQADAIQNLQDTKQTRPDEECPAGKLCLLVEDIDGTPHWYEIITEYIPPLPAGYTQLSYIESTGTQYIDTDVKWRYGYKIQMDLTSISNSGNYAFFGASNGSAYNQGEVSCFWYSGKFDTVVPYSNSTSVDIGFGTYSANTRYLFTYDNNATTANTYTSSNSVFYDSYVGTKNIWLFGTNRGDANSYLAAFKLHSAKMWDENGTLVRNFVPVQRDSDDEIGMYDLMHGVFYPNAGTGTFTAGPAAQ